MFWFLKGQVLFITSLFNFMRMLTLYSFLLIYAELISLEELSFNTFFVCIQVIVFSGKHQLNEDDIILQSESRFHLADHGRDEGLIGISLKNRSTADVKNYSLEIEVSFYFSIVPLAFEFCFFEGLLPSSFQTDQVQAVTVKQQASTGNVKYSWFLQFYCQRINYAMCMQYDQERRESTRINYLQSSVTNTVSVITWSI